jgi:transglutaminase-like putative cysteine protease
MVSAGMVFSYRTRNQPPGWVKALVAIAATGALVWFFGQMRADAGSDITTVEAPLTVLFVWIQVVHSFHVPARRDLLFSLGGSAGLMAVAAAQAIDLHFGLYAVAWIGFGLWALVELWASASGGGRASLVGVGSALTCVTVVAAALFLSLPAPSVSVRLNFLARAGSGGSIGLPGALAGDAGSASQLSRPGSRAGRSRIGGYLGFANRLDTALRGKLGNTVVMRVRAQRPSYWVGETFDAWDGEGWTATARASRPLSEGSPFILPVPQGANPVGLTDLQTFYVAKSTPDLVFHAESARELWFPTSTVFYSDDGTIVSPIGLGHGAIYTVESVVSSASPSVLRQASVGPALSPALEQRSTQLPHSYSRVQALAQSITAGAATTYDRVEALIAWIGTNTRYSTDIPPLSPGQDTVDEFLFGNRTGFCEQISTSLAVMLRSLGIPVREAVGYVPGPYNPVTDLYEIRAKDAHAWVQVWLPGYGWQSFDPTAVVPLANPSPGGTALRDLGGALGRVAVVPASAVVIVVGAVVLVVRWRRRRPATWAERVARDIERAGRRAGRPRRPAETIAEYAGALQTLSGNGSDTWRLLASEIEASAYGGREPRRERQRQMVAQAERLRISRRRRRVRI